MTLITTPMKHARLASALTQKMVPATFTSCLLPAYMPPPPINPTMKPLATITSPETKSPTPLESSFPTGDMRPA